MDQLQRKNFREFVRDNYTGRRKLFRHRRWLLPERLSDEQLDNLLAWHQADPETRPSRPVGFDPITWFLIAKLLIELIALWYRFQEST